MDNDLTHINDNHFEINLVAHLLNQIYIVPVTDELISSTSTGATASAPPFSFTA